MVSGDATAAGAGGRAGTMRFASHVLHGRWFMFFTSILIFMASAGGTYIFGFYSKAIKTSLGYDQQTLNTLSFCFFKVGANVGIVLGLINEVTPPWVVLALACGAGTNLAGYLMIYLTVSGRTARPPIWLRCIYIALGANSLSFANTGALVTAVKNFPDGASLVLLMAWLPAAISLLFIPTIRKAFFYFLYASIVLDAYLLVMNVVELEVLGFPNPAYYVTATVLLLLIFFPLVIVVQQELKTYLQPQPPPPPATNPVDLTITVDEKKTAPGEPPETSTNTPSPPAVRNKLFAALSFYFLVLIFVVTYLVCHDPESWDGAISTDRGAGNSAIVS